MVSSDSSIPPHRARDAEAAAELSDPKTQVVADRDAYLGQGSRDVGRRISEDQVELFIAGDVAQSLQQEFSRHTAEFVTLHDVGTSASLRMLSSLAGPAGVRVQRLSVRRQGHGVALAVLQFVEVPLADGTPVRLYATDIQADANARAQVARVLLAFSRLGVLMVGELPPHALTAQLLPLREAVQRGPWSNRDLLMVPLGSGTALAAQAAQLAGQSPVAVHVTPHAAKAAQVWGFIVGAWNRMQGAQGRERALPAELASAVARPAVPAAEAITQPMDLQPMSPRRATPAPAIPPMPTGAPMPVPGATRWQAYVDRCAAIKGALACCVFDMHSAQPLAQALGPPGGDRLAQQGSLLLNSVGDAARALGVGQGRPEMTITTAAHHLVLRPVPGHPGVAVHLVLQLSAGNLTLARMQLERIEPPQ